MVVMEEEKKIALRKLHETQQEKIDLLIAEEQDSKARLTLMVMSSINKSISANTDLTYAVHKEVSALKSDLEVHLVETEAAKNQGKGAYKIMRIIAPTLWAVMGVAIGTLYHNYGTFQKDTTSILANIDKRLQTIETRMTFYGLVEEPLKDIKTKTR